MKLANGEILLTNQAISQLEWWSHGQSFATDMKVLDLGTYDAILGYDWLKSHSPINHDWVGGTMEFMHNGTLVKIEGIQPAPFEVKELGAQQLVKWYVGNDIWTMVVVEVLVEDDPPPCSPEVQEVLLEFSDILAGPTSRPPSQVYDHAMPTLPSAVPINSKPYRYSPHHKDEIERQVKELLASSLIIPYLALVLMLPQSS